MDSKTKTVLQHADGNTRHIVIYNDTTLSGSDLQDIASQIGNCPKLESLTISGCNLRDTDLDVLTPAIATHLNLVKVDLSKNLFTDPGKLCPILAQGKKINTLDLSGNLVAWGCGGYSDFLKAVKKSDTLAVLRVTEDPYPIPGWEHSGITSFFAAEVRNLINFTISGPYGETTRSYSHYRCDANRGFATKILSMVVAGEIKTVNQVKDLNSILPAVLAIAEEQSSRVQIIGLLKDLNDKVLQEFGMAIGIEIYINEVDNVPADYVKGAELVPAAQSPTTLPTIQVVSQKLPVIAGETVRKQIEESRSNPLLLMELGQDAVSVVGDIALASLQATTSAPSMETPVRSMADFLAKFAGAKRIIEGHAAQAGTSLTSAKTQKNFLGGLWDRFFGQAEQLNSLADAGVLANEAGQVLQGMVPSLQGMEGRLSEQLVTTQQVIAAYRHVGNQICLVRQESEKALAEWRQEASQTVPNAATPELNAGEEPFYVQSLVSRLEFLWQVETQINGHVARHMMHGAIEQKQRQGVATLKGQNIPLIVEQVATFMRQVEELQRAEVINSIANATREATSGEQNTYVLAAKQTISAIENLVGSTQQALTDMGKALDERDGIEWRCFLHGATIAKNTREN